MNKEVKIKLDPLESLEFLLNCGCLEVMNKMFNDTGYLDEDDIKILPTLIGCLQGIYDNHKGDIIND